MRYNLESTLPIHAFQPLGGRHSPFKQGMTLEGGGGGGIVSAITDPISSALGTDGGGGGVLGALADVDKAVGDTVPGGWGTVAAVAVPYLAPQAMMGSLAATLGSEAAAAAALAAGTSATTGVIRGDDPEDILKNAALSGATSYGLNSLFGGSEIARDFDYIPDAPRDFDYVPDAPVRDFDTTDETQKMVEKGYLERMAELPGAAYDMTKSYVVNNPYPSAALGLGALSLSRMGGQQPQPQGQPTGSSSGYEPYTGGYGSSGGVADPYLLRNRVNASNIYNYRNPNTSRYAEGGEVKHFALGGISNALTRFTQPIEKAIIQPIGQALPFLKDVAPYAGILAAPFITSPFAAAGVGALSSGFGRPGSGFDMKRALMGGIAAYGASTVGAGLEAAGQENYAMPDGGTGFTSGSMDDAIGAVKESPKSFFRDTDAMQKGVGNLLSSDSDAATKAFGTKASIFKSGVPIVMGTSGMMAIDEANKMREEAERSAGAGRQEQADMLARIAKGRKRAEQAVRENPYMYAMGGQVDDEMGGDYSAMGMDQGNMQKGLFGLGYAAGGMPNLALSRLSQPAFNEGAVGGMQQFATGGSPRFLSGGGDGMSDSIPATIGGTQEARLADGEFVIPADVVSHLGNGSSKAGAKQLYSMMDRVRKARTGNEKQGRQIKPKKMMPA